MNGQEVLNAIREWERGRGLKNRRKKKSEMVITYDKGRKKK